MQTLQKRASWSTTIGQTQRQILKRFASLACTVQAQLVEIVPLVLWDMRCMPIGQMNYCISIFYTWAQAPLVKYTVSSSRMMRPRLFGLNLVKPQMRIPLWTSSQDGSLPSEWHSLGSPIAEVTSKNRVIAQLNRKLHAHHHFTTPYCPESNGTVESVCREVLRAARALLSEFRMDQKDWPQVIRLIQSTLNHAPRPSLGGRAPITVFSGLPADNPLRTMLPAGVAQVEKIDGIHARKLIECDKLVAALDKIHREVSESRTRKRKEAVKRHNEKNSCPLYQL